MECIPRLTHRLFPLPCPQKCLKARFRTHPITKSHQTRKSITRPENPVTGLTPIPRRTQSSSPTARAGWFLGLGQKTPTLPDIVKAGDPVLHEPAHEVRPEEIGSDRVKKIIDDMVQVMRKAPGVGLAAPQIGVPLRVGSTLCFQRLYLLLSWNSWKCVFANCLFQIIVLEDTKEYISYAPKEETKAQDRRPFDLLVHLNKLSYATPYPTLWAWDFARSILLKNCSINHNLCGFFFFYVLQVIINPKLKRKGNKTALFFEGCLR